jgi:glycosyltransferase involved in cell wall biosynthesis
LSFPFARRLACPHLTTLHGRLDLPWLEPLWREYSEIPLVSISNAQRAPLPDVKFLATVYHGLPDRPLQPRYEPGEYFAFIGRISPEKRVDRAIAVAKHLGVPLKIAAKVDAVDELSFRKHIAPVLDHPLIEFLGEINEDQKSELLGRARALLFLIDWPEPFGLAMIEAMACGTPVIAFDSGSVPEVIDHGVTGFVVNDMRAAIAAAAAAGSLDRRGCRAQLERRFSASRMARDYTGLYQALLRPISEVRPREPALLATATAGATPGASNKSIGG